MSALPPEAEMVQHGRDVRFVPQADIRQRDGPYKKRGGRRTLRTA
jgi:hypothetical protein